MKRWKMALLIFELLLFAIILVLPQVELPEFAFRMDSAPVVAKIRLTTPPAMVTPILGENLTAPYPAIERDRTLTGPLKHAVSEIELSQLCTLIC